MADNNLTPDNVVEPMTNAVSAALAKENNKLDIEKFKIIPNEDIFDTTKRFQTWFKAFERKLGQLTAKTDPEKRVIFLNHLSDEAVEEFESITELTTETDEYLNAVKTFKTVICDEDAAHNAEMKFMGIRPLPNETILSTLKRLSKEAKMCGFANANEEIMRMALAIIHDDKWRARRISQKWTKANLAEAMAFAKQQEQLVLEKRRLMSANGTTGEVKVVQNEERTCRNCGNNHEQGKCIAYNKICYNCGLPHHLSRCCHTPNPITGYQPRGNSSGQLNMARGYGRGYPPQRQQYPRYGPPTQQQYPSYGQPTRPQYQNYNSQNYRPQMQQSQRPPFGPNRMFAPRPQTTYAQPRRSFAPNRGSFLGNRGRGANQSGNVRLIDQEYENYEEYDQEYYVKSIEQEYENGYYNDSGNQFASETYEPTYEPVQSEQLALEYMLSPTAIEFYPNTDQNQYHQSSSQNQQEEKGKAEINDTFYEAVKNIRLE